MDEYTKLKNILEVYLNKPNIELSESKINFFHLEQIVDQRLEELRKIQFDSELVAEVNKSHTIGQRLGRALKKEVPMGNRLCTNLMALCNGKKSELTFRFKSPNSNWGSEHLTILKDCKSDQIYFEGYHSDKSFVEKHYDRIREYFATLEEYSELYQGGVGCTGTDVSQIITDGFLNAQLICDPYGRTKAITCISPSIDSEGMFAREWFQRPTLKEILKANEEEI